MRTRTDRWVCSKFQIRKFVFLPIWCRHSSHLIRCWIRRIRCINNGQSPRSWWPRYSRPIPQLAECYWPIWRGTESNSPLSPTTLSIQRKRIPRTFIPELGIHRWSSLIRRAWGKSNKVNQLRMITYSIFQVHCSAHSGSVQWGGVDLPTAAGVVAERDGTFEEVADAQHRIYN